MKNKFMRWLLLFIPLAACGCGDTIPALLREEKNLKNEVADYYSRIEDEAGVQWFNEKIANKLKDKFSDWKARRDKLLQAMDLNMVFNQTMEKISATMFPKTFEPWEGKKQGQGGGFPQGGGGFGKPNTIKVGKADIVIQLDSGKPEFQGKEDIKDPDILSGLADLEAIDVDYFTAPDKRIQNELFRLRGTGDYKKAAPQLVGNQGDSVMGIYLEGKLEEVWSFSNPYPMGIPAKDFPNLLKMPGETKGLIGGG